MENLYIYLVTDNAEGNHLAKELFELETNVIEINLKKLSSIDLSKGEIVILIILLNDTPLDNIISSLKKYSIPETWQKFIFLRSKPLKKAIDMDCKMFHMEFLQRPVRLSDFLLLIEKTILTEKFKLLLNEASIELKERGEALEHLYDTLRKKNLDKEISSTEVFTQIINMQKRLDIETLKAQKAIEKISNIKEKNLFLENMDNTEEILGSVLPYKSLKTKDDYERLRFLEENAGILEETLIKAQNRIVDLERELGKQALKGIENS